MDRFETLLTAYLEGPLNADHSAELADLVRGQLAHRKRFLFQTELSGLLWAHHAPADRAPALAARTLLCLPGAAREENTIGEVMELVRTVPAPPRPVAIPDLRPPRSRWPISPVWIIAALVAIIFVPAIWVAASLYTGTLSPQDLAAVATLQSCTGKTQLVSPLTDAREPVRAGQSLLLMKGVETSGTATIAFRDDTTFTMTANEFPARIWLRNMQPGNVIHRDHSFGKRVTIDLGSVRFDVTHQDAETPMIIITPNAEVRVVGTVFTVNVTPSTTDVSVERGEVHVTRLEDKKTTALLVNQSVSTADPELKAVSRK